MRQDYTRMQKDYMDGLSKLGLSPQGRHDLDKRFEADVVKPGLEAYVDAKEIKHEKGVRPKAKTGHNRVLSRPGTFETGASGYSGSFTPHYYLASKSLR